MRKMILALLLLFLPVCLIFAGGTAEEQQAFFESLPQILQAQNKNEITSSETPGISGSDIITRDMDTLERLYKYVDRHFLYDIDYEKVYDAMATALFESLDDDYTYYVVSENKEEYVEETLGTYGGLGIYFSKTYVQYQNPEEPDTLYCNITQVFPGTPSSKAGLLSGDYITHINGESVDALEATECSNRMKGLPGTEVTITIKRRDTSFDITLVREIINVPTVESAMLNDDTGYMIILEFTQSTALKVKMALTELINQGMKNLIIDLRDNPGGDIDTTLSIADMFLNESKLLLINYKDPSRNITYMANEGTLVDPSVKIAILTNEGTASSAEILSSTMRDNERATLIGETTFGKGVMQVVSPFGNGYTSVTTASFLPPSGKEIHKHGVEPDIVEETIIVNDDEIPVYEELLKGTVLEDFVDSNPQYSKENIELFISTHPEIHMRPIVLTLIVRNEYLSRIPTEERPLADPEYDNVLKRALEFLETGL